MTTYTRAFYAWLIQPTDTCPKWVNEAVSLLALLITCWQFLVYCCKTGREQLYEFNDALAGLAVRLTCTTEDIEYYNRLQHQAKNTKDFCDFGYVKGEVVLTEFLKDNLVIGVMLDQEDY